MLQYRPRAIEPVLEARLGSFPVVILTGARQTGKSTLARRLGGGEGRTYLTLDDYGVLDQAKQAPDQLIARGPEVTLDEVQRAPELLLAIKRAVDEDRRPGRFLLTGSANLALMGQVSETLAGRAVYLTLGPLTHREARGLGEAGRWSTLLDHEVGEWSDVLSSMPAIEADIDWPQLARAGGYPTPALEIETDDDRTAWFEGYLRTYLERDLQQLSSIDNLGAFQRLVRAAALRAGGLQNQADLARDVGLPPSTAQRYLDLLEASYQLVRLPAYSVNRTKRLVKSPKLYWNDTGLALHLAGVEPGGAHLENLVVADLLAWRETRTRRPEILFWRTSSGAEVDIVIETANRLVPIEAKMAKRLRVGDARHLETFLDEYADRAPAGVLLYGGTDIHWLTDRVIAVPWNRII